MGFDAVWLAEIHFQKDRSVLASPLVIAAALAACTRRVKIGIAVQVLPLSHPLRLAEDVATVDHLAKGRLEFGVGGSGLPGHYQGFNIPYSESRDRFLETLEILTKAWTQERFSHQGKYFQFQDVCIMPKPYQKPHPPIRIAATTPETYPPGGTARGAAVRGRPHGVAFGSQASPADVPGGVGRLGARRARRRRHERPALGGQHGAAGSRGGRGEHDGLLPLDQSRSSDRLKRSRSGFWPCASRWDSRRSRCG
jgi:alkanesulfonate monooxygenase SsuD/methylene tetrahydromethanopterin reductase-like flavin-dependent oxidoreductase (luciferase family)